VKSLFSTSPRTGGEKKLRGFGRRRVDKGWPSQVDPSRLSVPCARLGVPDGLELERRSMRGGSMNSDIISPMKPSSLPSGAQRAIFLRLRRSRPRMTCHLSLNGLWLVGIAVVSKIRRSREFRGLVAQYQINPITDNQARVIVSQGS
jgi:hypothetical protein